MAVPHGSTELEYSRALTQRNLDLRLGRSHHNLPVGQTSGAFQVVVVLEFIRIDGTTLAGTRNFSPMAS